VLEPVIVLALAWSLGGIIGLTGTADFIAKGLLAGGLPLWALPSITSVLRF
jgi:Na+/H+ antiporter NhaC